MTNTWIKFTFPTIRQSYSEINAKEIMKSSLKKTNNVFWLNYIFCLKPNELIKNNLYWLEKIISRRCCMVFSIKNMIIFDYYDEKYIYSTSGLRYKLSEWSIINERRK